jgi:hypothetical protein
MRAMTGDRLERSQRGDRLAAAEAREPIVSQRDATASLLRELTGKPSSQWHP